MALSDTLGLSSGVTSAIGPVGQLLGAGVGLGFGIAGQSQISAGQADIQAGYNTVKSAQPLIQQGIQQEIAGSQATMTGATAFNAAQQAQIGLEQQVEQQRQNAMEILAYRSQVENIRNVQRAAAATRSAAVASGAFFGSGRQGAQAAETATGAFNALGTQQQLEIGRNTFAFNSAISQQRIAQAQADLAMKQGQFQIQQGGFTIQQGKATQEVGQAQQQFGAQEQKFGQQQQQFGSQLGGFLGTAAKILPAILAL